MFVPYLRYGCTLEINNARTAAYVSAMCDVCTDVRREVQVSNKCDILNWELDPTDGTTIQATNYTTPGAADCPWVDASNPESAKFLGYMIDRVTKPAHVKRNVTTKISGSGGGILETLRPEAQILEFEVYLFACDSTAMEYGMRWLTSSLIGGGCETPCTLCELEYRDSCVEFTGTPTNAEFDTGRWILHDAGVISSPEYMNEPVDGGGYVFRKAKFTLGSQLPWKYNCSEICLDAGSFPAGPTEACGSSFENFFCNPSTASCAITEPSVVGETALIVELTAGSQALSGVVLEIIPDENGWVCDPGTAPAGFTPPDACDIVYFKDVPARHTLTYDTSVEKVTMETNGGLVVDGTPYMILEQGFQAPSFPVVRCGQFCVKVSVDSCALAGSPEITIRTVHREY